MYKEVCPVCQNEIIAGEQPWHWYCMHCKYEKSNLQPTINLHSAHQLIDEEARETGLRELRISNFKKLLSNINSPKKNESRLLDVGCAHGWFLETARYNFQVLGLEPDKNVFEATSRKGLPVRLGYFPGALVEDERFDVVVFNDVIEHIPDIAMILEACHQHLDKGGLLVLNLPSSKGVFYRLSKIFCKLGYPGFFERLWQKNLPSPHLHYFNSNNLVTLLQNKGFEVKTKGNLSTLSLAGLYTRISYTGKLGLLPRTFIYFIIAICLPILKILPSDIIYVVSVRR